MNNSSSISTGLHHLFRYIWNGIFVLSYPILATFGLLFIGLTYLFSGISRLLTRFRSGEEEMSPTLSGSWKTVQVQAFLNDAAGASVAQSTQESAGEGPIPVAQLLEAKLSKKIMFGPEGFTFRRADGVPSVLEEHIFGSRVYEIEEGLLLEKWNTVEPKELPDFTLCLYLPEEDQLRPLTRITCFDWHLSEREGDTLRFKWFDGIQGDTVVVHL
ncbi:hypothetical protein [Nitritalea halalkaliphila]|nr:hypothetical protein [Nitritalea halalkaliphila]